MPLNFVAKAAIQVGLMGANMALSMSKKIEGPRLDNLKFTGGDYGSPLPLVWGMRRMDVPIFWSEDLKEIKRQRKTKGGKYNEYTYFGTWAVALAGHEISGVSRVWFDTHLVLDLTGAGPVTPFDFGDDEGFRGAARADLTQKGIGPNWSDRIAAYLGTETQEPDPRMLATVEALHGEGSCPAYRGTAYICFKDIPLEKLGNRIPQVSVEFASAIAAGYPYETVAGISGTFVRYPALNTDFSRLLIYGDKFEMWDLASRSLMVSGDWPSGPAEPYPSIYNTGFFADGTLWFCGISQDKIYQYSPDLIGGATVVFTFDPSYPQQAVRAVMDGDGVEHWGTIASSISGDVYFDGALLDLAAATGYASFKVRSYFTDGWGDVWCCGDATDTTAVFYRLVDIGVHGGPSLVVATGLSDISGGGGASDSGNVWGGHYRDTTVDHFILRWGNVALYAIDVATGTVSFTRGGHTEVRWLVNMQPGATSAFIPDATAVWTGFIEISLADLTNIRTINPINWTSGFAGLPTIYDPVNHALLFSSSVTSSETWMHLDRLGNAGVTLATIAGDVADLCGITAYDFSALDQTVQGWSVTQGQASNMLEPLLDAYDSDIRPHDFTLQGVKRSGVSGGTILTERFVKGDPRYSVKVRQAAELPRAVIVTFADIDADQQPNTARADRPLEATGAKGEMAIDMGTWASDPDEARQLTDRFHRRLWNGRKEVMTALTAQQLALEPADCRTLDLDGESDIYRLLRITVKASGELDTVWQYDHPSLAVNGAASGAVFDGRTESVVVVAAVSKGFVLDIPLLRDADNSVNPLLYFAAAPYTSGGSWGGAVFYEAIDGEYSDEVASVDSASPATWGYSTDVLPDANPNVWDRGSSVNIFLQTGSLTGTTEAAIDANPNLNLALLGDEILNFTTATLQGDGSYTLSGFKRGRRGTEWACDDHAARDAFLLLDTAVDEAMGLSDVGDAMSFKAVSSGRSIASAFPIPVTYTGASLKPYAPCHLEAVKDAGSGDWTITWVRRSRIGGAWTSGTSVPLGEASEEYDVVITHPTATTRTITVTSPSATYTAAQQVTDGGAVAVGDLDCVVYQISASVDRGFAAALAA